MLARVTPSVTARPAMRAVDMRSQAAVSPTPWAVVASVGFTAAAWVAAVASTAEAEAASTVVVAADTAVAVDTGKTENDPRERLAISPAVFFSALLVRSHGADADAGRYAKQGNRLDRPILKGNRS